MNFTFRLPVLLIIAGWFNSATSQFVKNQGQVIDDLGELRPDVNFTFQTNGAKLFFHNDGISYVLYDFFEEETAASLEAEKWGRTQEAAMLSMRIKQELITLDFIGANESFDVQYDHELNAFENYYYPHCGPEGITGVSTYDKITYVNVYDNIDVVFYANGTQLKYDVVVHPGGDLSEVKFKYNGVKSGKLVDQGLLFETEIRPLFETIPVSFIDESKKEIEVGYVLSEENVMSFEAEEYDHSQKLVIDPVLTWATIMERTVAGTASSIRANVHVDGSGNFYHQINTYNPDLPIANPGGSVYLDPTYNPSSGLDVFFAQYDVNRNLIWSTYLGGTGNQSNYYDHSMDDDGSSLFLCGTTNSTNFPVMNQGGGAFYIGTNASGTKGWFSKFNISTGAMEHCTYMDYLDKLVLDVDNAGNLVIASTASSSATITMLQTRAGAYNQATHAGGNDLMVTRFNTSLALTWGTFIGGADYEETMGIVHDQNDNIFILARAGGDSGPLVNPGGGAYYDNTFGDKYDLWFVKLNTSGGLAWSTLYGGTGLEGLSYSQIEVTTNNEIVATSATRSTGMATLNPGGGAYFLSAPAHLTNGWGGDPGVGFMARFNTSGVLLHGTYMGVNGESNYIQGQTPGACNKHYLILQSIAFPTTSVAGSYNVTNASSSSNYLAIELDANYGISWASYVHSDSVYMERTVSDLTNGRLYVTGTAQARLFPFTDPGGGAYYDDVFDGTSTSRGYAIMEFDIGGSPTPTVSSGSSSTICSGESTDLEATGSGTINWYTVSSGGTPVATGSPVTVSPTSTTTYYVEVVSGGCASARSPITITVNAAPTVTVPGTGDVCIGNTITLSPTTGGTWSSSNTSISTITNAGVVTGVAAGSANMTFTNTTTGCSSTPSAGAITVNANPTVTVPGTGEVCVGATITLSPTTGGTWSSSNTSIATITNAGVVTGVAAGSADMTYTNSTTGCSSTAAAGTVTVNAAPSITVPGTGEVCVGNTIALSPTTGGTWSSSNTSIATITNAGVVTGVAAGSADMTFTNTTTGCSSTAAAGTVTVNAVPTVTVPGAGNVCIGNTITLSPTTGGTWSSSNTSIATITNAGVVTGVAAGSADMTFTNTTTGCSSTASAGTVTVDANPTVTVPGTGDVCEGSTITLSPTTGGTWSSSNTSIATITNAGVVTGISAGSADMTFTNTTTGCSSTASAGTVSVTAAPTVTVPNSGNTCIGSTLALSPTTGGTWSSSNTSIATITNAGVVTGVAAGSADMTFTNTTTGCSSTAAAGTITVNADPTVTVPGTGDVCEGSTITLSPTTGGTWSSSNTAIATITNGGIVTGVAAGSADMTFTNTTTGCSSTASAGTVTVSALDDASFSYSSGTYCLTGTDPTASITGLTGGTFTIDNSGVIDGSTGLVDLDANGVTSYVITYTTSGTCPNSETFNLSVTSSPTSGFAYAGTPYCEGAGLASVTYDPGASGGVFAPVPATTDLVINSNTGEVDLNSSLPGTYTVENDIAAVGGCAASNSTTTITITAQDDATFDYSGATSFCENETNPVANVTGAAGGAFTSTPVGITVNGSTGEIDLSTSTAGASYDITYTTTGTCPGNSTLTVTLNESPTAPTGGSTATSNTICEGESLDITGSGSTGTGVTYSVFDALTGGTNLGSTPLTVSPTASTTYYVEAFNSNGCGNVGGRDAVAITVNPLPNIDAGTDETICPGDNVTLTATGTGTVVWSTTETTTSITVTPSSSTTYTVTLIDGNSCENSDSVLVTVVSNGGSLVATDDSYTSTSGTTETFDVMSNDTQSGSTPSIVLTPSNGSATVNIDGTIEYTSNDDYVGTETFNYEICDALCVTICDTATVTITITMDDEFSVPGGFSPNSDNINDLFVITGLDQYPDNKLSIFNRWGNLVYSAAPYNNDWDGTPSVGVIMGDKVTTGTYFYILELGDSIEPLKGSIEIKRD